MRKSFLVVALLFSVMLVAAAAWFGRNIAFQQQWPLFEALRATAAIIFAVVGAWLAIVYPERLKRSLGGGDGHSGAVSEKFTKLFTPIVHSTVILGLVLLTGIVAPILKQIPWFLEHVHFSRSIAFTILVTLTIWQIWTVVLTLEPADIIKSQADLENAQAASMESIRGLAQTEQPPARNDD